MTARADVTVIIVHHDLTDPTQCVFHRDAEIYFLVYTKRSEDYGQFFAAVRDAAQAKQAREYGLDMANQRCR
jgi:chloramphenicol O-acetyltransferase